MYETKKRVLRVENIVKKQGGYIACAGDLSFILDVVRSCQLIGYAVNFEVLHNARFKQP